MKVVLLLLSLASSCLTSPSCPPGWVHAHTEGCFRFLAPGATSWLEATQQCEQAGGYLAEPGSPSQMEFLAGLAALEEELYGVKSWWIGAVDVGHEGVWEWTHSMQVVTETFWATGCPSSEEENILDCALVQLTPEARLAWRDVNCRPLTSDELIAPLCQRDTAETPSTVTPGSTVTTATRPTTITAASTPAASTTPRPTTTEGRPKDCTVFCHDQEGGNYADHCCSSTYCTCLGQAGFSQTCPQGKSFCDYYDGCIYSDDCFSNDTCCE